MPPFLEEAKSLWLTLRATGMEPIEALAHAAQEDPVVAAHLWLEAMRLVEIPAGNFLMGGADEGGLERFRDNFPSHAVTIVRPFRLGAVPIAQAAWVALMGRNPSRFQGEASLPVETVSWADAQQFLARLNEVTAAARPEGQVFRLPSEAEWEYACRAGTDTDYSFGDDRADTDTHGWFEWNAHCETHPVGRKQPNPWGLYDLHGNVMEWCEDAGHRDYRGAPGDGSAWTAIEGNGVLGRVLRGGSYRQTAWHARSHHRCFARDYQDSDAGFRVAMGLPHVDGQKG
jgi:formylglycine-generating enzyme required for sulfatase activity